MSQNSSTTSDLPKRARATKACNHCRRKKTKCDWPKSPCSQCRMDHTPCISQGNHETLERVYIETIIKLYHMNRNMEWLNWPDIGVNARNEPLVHEIAARLGCVPPDKDNDSKGFETADRPIPLNYDAGLDPYGGWNVGHRPDQFVPYHPGPHQMTGNESMERGNWNAEVAYPPAGFNYPYIAPAPATPAASPAVVFHQPPTQMMGMKMDYNQPPMEAGPSVSPNYGVGTSQMAWAPENHTTMKGDSIPNEMHQPWFGLQFDQLRHQHPG